MTGNGNGNGVWKWICAILVTILLTGTPAVVQAIKAPSQEDFQKLEENQQELLVRITKIEVQVVQLQMALEQHELESP